MMHELAATLSPFLNQFLSADYLWMALVVLIGACLQGAGGIGFGMFVGPVLAITHQELVPGPVLVLSAMLSFMSALRECRAIDVPAFAYAFAGRVPASILAGMAFAVLPIRVMSIVFALLILLGVWMSQRGWRLRAVPRNWFLAGAMSGFMGTITSVGAPPMALAFQDFSGPRLRATLGAFFTAGCLVSLAALAWVGRFGMVEFRYGASLVVPMMLGFAVSNHVVRHVKPEQIRSLILAMSGGAAVVLLLLQLV